jgi:hypothetical protein
VGKYLSDRRAPRRRPDPKQRWMTFVGNHAKGIIACDLSFAKNASAGIASRCNAFITVMQAAKVRNLDDPSDTRDLPSVRTLLVES